MAHIPFVRDLAFEYGVCDQVSANVRRVIANNPSPFTFYGTGTYILGHEEVAVIDPGPTDPQHIDSILKATRTEKISHMLVTHTHRDHSPGCALLRDYCDAPTYGFGPHGSGRSDGENVQVEEGGDMDFSPDVVVKHGDVIEGENWSVECVYTPGHTSNHVCFQLQSERALFTGDHVMGWSTSVISPPDGDMASYMNSLRLLQSRDDIVYWPTHGPPITRPKPHVDAFIAHRIEREDQIRTCLQQGIRTVGRMVPVMYADTDMRLYGAAGQSVLAAIQGMVSRGEVVCDGEPTIRSEFALS